jgi:dipeptidyl aminopeptidase/acylaminoacyl peptidase
MGWVVLERFAMPILAEGDAEPNDTFIEQVVANAEAAVNELCRRGVAARGAIAVGGHSYGAFMTAHLLAHTDLFCAGIARSGAYNRTLTPMGFQAEERDYWKVPHVYHKLSPFSYARELAVRRAPLLLIHGENDPNAGTHSMQSERM